MEKNKRTLAQTLVCIVLLCMIWVFFYFASIPIAKKNHRKIELFKDDFRWVYQIEDVKVSDDEVVLSGFAFELNVNAYKENVEIVLHDIESGQNYFPKMKYKEREDVNQYFSCEYDYSQSGFEASFDMSKSDLSTGDYEILLRILGEKKAYQSGSYLSDGKIVYANPQEFQSLDVAGTELEEVLETGILRVYRPDWGVYVYQYEKELYWIIEPEYERDENGEIYIQYRVGTTQSKRLPQSRLNAELNWDNLSFGLRDSELEEKNTGKYLVAKSSIPKEYSVTKIWTGKIHGEWIWIQYFRPYYEFVQ